MNVMQSRQNVNFILESNISREAKAFELFAEFDRVYDSRWLKMSRKGRNWKNELSDIISNHLKENGLSAGRLLGFDKDNTVSVSKLDT